MSGGDPIFEFDDHRTAHIAGEAGEIEADMDAGIIELRRPDI